MKVNVAADSVYLDWENVWAPAGQIGNDTANSPQIVFAQSVVQSVSRQFCSEPGLSDG